MAIWNPASITPDDRASEIINLYLPDSPAGRDTLIASMQSNINIIITLEYLNYYHLHSFRRMKETASILLDKCIESGDDLNEIGRQRTIVNAFYSIKQIIEVINRFCDQCGYKLPHDHNTCVIVQVLSE